MLDGVGNVHLVEEHLVHLILQLLEVVNIQLVVQVDTL